MALMKKLEVYCPPITPKIVDAKTNEINTEKTIKNWKLGPEKPSADPKANSVYWMEMADAWSTSEAEARRQVCSNCEYFNNTVEMMEAMDAIPYNKYDVDAGGRGYCHKFEFICHNLRSCMAWEAKDYYMEEENGD